MKETIEPISDLPAQPFYCWACKQQVTDPKETGYVRVTTALGSVRYYDRPERTETHSIRAHFRVCSRNAEHKLRPGDYRIKP